MRYSHTLAAVAALIAVTGLAGIVPAHAAGPMECKPAVAGLGLTDDQAQTVWEAAARQAYGSGWDNFGLARNKQYGQINLALAVEQTISASPCRPQKISQITNLNGIKLQNSFGHNDNGPTKPFGGVKGKNLKGFTLQKFGTN